MGIEGYQEKDANSPENTEEQLKLEFDKLEVNTDEINSNLDQIEASSPTRVKKINDFIEKNWFAVMGGSIGIGGALGLGESLASGNWERVAIGLGLGVGAGKALEMIAKRSIEKSKNS